MNRAKKIVIPGDYPERVFALRRRFRLTQEQFADRLGVSFASVNRWENGQNKPTRSAWARLTRIAESDELPLPLPESSIFRIFPDSVGKFVRINLSQVVSYRQPRDCEIGCRGFKPVYELHEYTAMFMNGGHKHFLHVCEVEMDKIFGVDSQSAIDAVTEGQNEG